MSGSRARQGVRPKNIGARDRSEGQRLNRLADQFHRGHDISTTAVTDNPSTQTKPNQSPIIFELKTESRKRGTPRILVTLEDDRSALLSADLVVRERLKAGLALRDEEHWQDLLAAQAALEARQRLINLLSTRRKTRREAEAYLQRLGFPEAAVEQALEAAAHLGYLDDTAYAGAYVRTKDRTQKEGPRSIAAGLGRRGVDRDIIDEAIAPIEPDEIQKPKALELARKRWATHTTAKPSRQDSPREAKQKLSAFLLRRGFTPDVVYSVVREVTGELQEWDEDSSS